LLLLNHNATVLIASNAIPKFAHNALMDGTLIAIWDLIAPALSVFKIVYSALTAMIAKNANKDIII